MDGIIIASMTDGEKCQKQAHEGNVDSLGTGLLSSLTKRAVKEGGEALKLEVYRECAMIKLGQTYKTGLL